MRSKFFVTISLITMAVLGAATAKAQFTSGGVVVLREGDGTGALTANGSAIFLDEYDALTASQATPSFSENVTGALAASGVNLLMSGTAASEGQMTRSADGHLLVVPGYNVQAGTTGALPSATAAQAPRGYVTVDAGGVISPFTGSPDLFTTTNIRSVAMNGANVYGAGATGGVLYFATDSYVDTAQANNRVMQVYNGNLYFSTASGATGVWGFNGTPTSPANATLLIAIGASGTSPYGFSISPDATKAYIADDGGASGNATGFGVERWNLANGTWTLAYSIATDATDGSGGARGLAVDWTGANPVIYATSAPSGTGVNKLVRIVDDSGANSTVTVLAVAGGNEHFSGVTLAPTTASAAPVFGLQPTSLAVAVTQVANFTVAAVGYPAASFQWQVSANNGGSWSNLTEGGAYAGTTSTKLTVTTADTSLNGDEFRCAAINSVGTTNSNAATLTVTLAQAPMFSAQPLAQVVSSGQSAVFAVAVTGNPTPTLQWQRAPAGSGTFADLANGGSFAGVTTTTLTIAGTTIAMSGDQYRCVATNLASAATSNAANLTVNPSTTPPFVQGNLVVLRTGVGGSVALTNTGSAIYVDEFDPLTANQTAPLFSTNVTNSLAGAGNFVMSGVATAEGHMSLSADGYFLCIPVFKNLGATGSIAANATTLDQRGYVLLDANGNYSAPVVSTTAFQGTDIRAAFSAGTAIYGSGANGGIFLFQTESFIETQINNTRVVRIENGNICFSTALTGNVGIWQFQGIPTGNATVTQVIPITGSGASPYGFSFSPGGTTAYVADDGSNSTSGTWAGIQHWVLSGGTWTMDYIIRINPAAPTVGARGLVVDWSGANPIIYATTSNSNSGSAGNQLVKIVDDSGANSTVTILATAGANTGFRAVDFAPVVNASSLAPTITTPPADQTITAGQSGVFQIGASGAPAPTLLWQISTDHGSTWSDLSDNGTFSGTTTPILTVATTFAMADTQFELRVEATNFGGTTVSSAANVTVAEPPPAAPAITTQPLSGTANAGDDVNLTVVTSGFPVPTYQWFYGTMALADGMLPDGATIAGSQNATLTIGNVQLGEAGNYTVVATNNLGNVTSNVTVLSVEIFPDVENTTDQTVFAGQNAVFTANVTGLPAPTLQWQRRAAGASSFTPLTEGGGYNGTTTTTLTVSNVTLGMSGDQFELEATNDAGSTSGPSGQLTVSAGITPNITTQPGNLTVTVGQGANFTSAATGTPTPTMQWQVSTDSGVTWGNLTDNGNVTGSLTGTLALSNTTLAMTGFQYRMLAINGAGTTPSNAATLTVSAAPAAPGITTAPTNQTVTAGGNATYTVAASGNPAPSFQWQVSTNGGATFGNLTDGGNISGAGTATLTVSAVTGGMTGTQYRALAINTLGTATSSAATLTVNTAPAFTTQPGNATVTAGGNATFTAAASGNPAPTLRWQVSTDGGTTFGNLTDGGNISGSTTGTLTVSGTTGVMSGYQYRAQATNVVSTTTSNAATLTVNTAPAITTQPGNTTVTEGGNATFTVAASGQPTPGLQWQVSTNGGATWGSLTDGATVAGSTNGTLTLIGTTGAMSGNEYRAVATNVVSAVTSSAATLTVNTAPGISTQPVSQSVSAGGNVTFSVTASGRPPASFQWQVSTDGGLTWGNMTDGSGIAGATTSSLSLSGAMLGMTGYKYRVVASNSVSSTTSDAVTLTVDASPMFTTQPENATVTEGGNATFTVAASGVPTPGFQWQVSTDEGATWSNLTDDGNVSGSTTGTLTVSNTTGDISGSEFRAVATNSAGTATSDAAGLTVNTAPAITTQPGNATVTEGGNATFTAAASGQPTPTLQWQISTNGTFTDLSDNGTVSGSTTGTLLVSNVTLGMAGQEYRVVATNSVSSTTSGAAALAVNPKVVKPTVTMPPTDAVVLNGKSASFAVTATGTPPLTYQWLFNGKAIAGATNATYVIAKASTKNVGNYTVVVTNAQGNTTSEAAALVIGVAPKVTAPARATVTAGNSVTFKTKGSGTPAPDIFWQISSDGGTSWSNLTTGANVTATDTMLTLANTTGGQNGDLFRVIASNAIGAVTSKTAALTVNEPPGVPVVTSNPSGNGTVMLAVNASITFTATDATGTGLKYQWNLNGKKLTGATKTIYTLSKAGGTNSGVYTVTVSNKQGSKTSDSITLVVLAKPTIKTQPKNATEARKAATFSVVANNYPGLGNLTYQWTFNSGNLTEGGQFQGTTSAKLTINGVTSANAGPYQVQVSNDAGTTPSGMATLKVR